MVPIRYLLNFFSSTKLHDNSKAKPYFNNLPKDFQIQIAPYLDFLDIMNLSLINWHFKKLIIPIPSEFTDVSSLSTFIKTNLMHVNILTSRDFRIIEDVFKNYPNAELCKNVSKLKFIGKTSRLRIVKHRIFRFAKAQINLTVILENFAALDKIDLEKWSKKQFNERVKIVSIWTTFLKI